MATKTSTIRECKPGTYVIVDDEACKVLNYAKSKPGKHGAAKVRIEVVGIFDGKKRQLMKPADSNVDVPIIEKKKAQVISVSEDIASLMDLETYETFDAKIPEELKGLDAGDEVLYWKLDKKVLIKQKA